MKKLIPFLLLSFSANAYVSTGLGVGARALDADRDQKTVPMGQAHLNIGLMGENFDFSIDSDYSISRQKEFAFNYNSQSFVDDFNWFQVKVGPTIKYHVKSTEGNSWAPLLGVYYTHASLGNSVEFTDSVTGEKEDFNHELWGYGAKIGIQFRDALPTSKWLESINYNIVASHTRYRGMEGDYLAGGRVRKFDGDEPSGLVDTSIVFSVGATFGEKTFKNLKSSAKSMID